jgi:hypothetical protein
MSRRWEKLLATPWGLVALASLTLLVLSAAELPPPGAHSNDLSLHVSLARGLERNRTLDFWHQADLGYPVLRIYQPLYHVALAGLDVATGSRLGLSAWATYSVVLIAVALPLGVFLGVRRWLVGEGFALGEAAWAGAASACLAALSTSFTGFGFDPLQATFATFGVITQSLAMVFFAPAFAYGHGFIAGQPRSFWPSLAFAFLVCSSSLIVGVMLVACTALRGFIEVLHRGDRQVARRLLLLFVGIGLVTASLWLPLVLDSPWIYNPADLFARWVHAGFGGADAFKALVSGTLLDGRAIDRLGRPPVMSLLFVLGAFVVVGLRRQHPGAVTFLFGGWALWFSLFVGREVWGPVLYMVPLLRSYQWGRFEAMLQFWAIVIAAIGLSQWLPVIWSRWRRRWQRQALVVTGIAVAIALLWSPLRLAGLDRRVLQTVRAGKAPEHAEAIAARLADDTTRVCVGGPLTWESRTKEDGIWMGVALQAWGVPTVGRIYQGMGVAAAAEYAWQGETDWPAKLFGIGNWLAPCDLMPKLPILAPPTEVAPTLCLGVSREPPPLAFFSALASSPPRRLSEAQVVELQKSLLASPEADCFLPFSLGKETGPVALPEHPARLAPLRVQGSRFGEAGPGRAESRLQVESPARGAIVFSLPYHPKLRGWVDGVERRPFPVLPGFAAIDVEQGRHTVLLVYESDRVRDTLLVATVAVLAVASVPWRRHKRHRR